MTKSQLFEQVLEEGLFSKKTPLEKANKALSYNLADIHTQFEKSQHIVSYTDKNVTIEWEFAQGQLSYEDYIKVKVKIYSTGYFDLDILSSEKDLYNSFVDTYGEYDNKTGDLIEYDIKKSIADSIENQLFRQIDKIKKVFKILGIAFNASEFKYIN